MQIEQARTLRTKRLLELSNSILSPEIANAADFRWIDPKGNLVVGDSQARKGNAW